MYINIFWVIHLLAYGYSFIQPDNHELSEEINMKSELLKKSKESIGTKL